MKEWKDLEPEEKTPEAGYREAQRRIAKARKAGAENLNLNFLRLERIPTEVMELTALTNLFLIDTQITDLSPLAGLRGLTDLWLDITQVTDLSPLAGLSALTNLRLDSTPVTDLSPLADLSALSNLRLGRTRVTNLSPLAGLSALTNLRLDSTPVTDLSPLAGLSALTNLRLDSTPVTDLSPLAGLSALTNLRLDSTPVTDLSPLAGLRGLTDLRLDSTPVTDLSPLAGLKGLTDLMLSYTPITDLSPLAGLRGLTDLRLNNTPVTDLSPLAGLTALTTLQVDNTQVIDLSPLASLMNLKRIDIDDTQVTDLSPLSGLIELDELWLINTPITDLSPLAGLKALTILRLEKTQVADLSPLGGLTGLIELRLKDTPVTDLSQLAGLQCIKKLDLQHNNIANLKPLLPLITKGIKLVMQDSYMIESGIYLYGNPLVDPPLEVAQQGTEAVLRYWDLIEELGTIPNYEGRIILIGRGGSGKTSLLEKLANPEVTIEAGQRDSTVGVNIRKDLPFHYGRQSYQGRVWDFGGQVEQHAIHLYFFGRRSLYVVVVDRRQELPYDEWLRMINLLGRRDGEAPTPVVVLFNDRDNDRVPRPTFDVEKNQAQYPNLQLLPYSVDLGRPNEGETPAEQKVGNDSRWEGFVDLLSRELYRLPVMTDILTPYAELPEVLEGQREQGKAYLSWEAFGALCKDLSLEFPPMWADAAAYLHAIGEVIHYHDLPETSLLRRNVIVDVSWATDAIYKVLELPDVVKNGGAFAQQDLTKAWAEYSATDREILTDLLLENAFQICYRLPQGGDFDYLAPALLPESDAVTGWVSAADHLFFRLRYDGPVIPDIIARLIVRLHDLIKNQEHYRHGAVFHSPDADIRALVRLSRPKSGASNEIEIELDGRGPAATSFLAHLRTEFNRIHNQFFQGVRPEEVFSCCCSACAKLPVVEKTSYRYGKLAGMLRKGRTKVYCEELEDDVSIPEILFGVYPADDEKLRLLEQIEQTTKGLTKDMEELQAVAVDTNARVQDIQAALGRIEAEVESLNENFFTNAEEQKAYLVRLEQLATVVNASTVVPEEEKPKDWHDSPLKNKIKVGINFTKVAERYGIVLDGLDLKFEQEFDLSGSSFRRPKSWAEFKRWFVGDSVAG